MSRRDIDPGALQVLLDDRPQHRSRIRHNHECLAHQILWTDGFERCETMITRQNHHQWLLDENTVRQLWHASFPPEKCHIDFPPSDASRHGSGKCSFDAAHTWAASRKESRIARTVALKLKSRESSKKTDSLSHGSGASTSRPSVIRPRREHLQRRTCWQALY